MLITTDKSLQNRFMHWQCMERLYAARQAAGFPVDAANPLVCYGTEGTVGVELTVLIVKKELKNLVAQYKFNAQKTIDPIERLEWVVQQTSADYYQKPDSFMDLVTALCPKNQAYVAKLLAASTVRMAFQGNGQGYIIPASVIELASDDLRFQFTQLHNFHFNARVPQPHCVLAFVPDWSQAKIWDPSLTNKEVG